MKIKSNLAKISIVAISMIHAEICFSQEENRILVYDKNIELLINRQWKNKLGLLKIKEIMVQRLKASSYVSDGDINSIVMNIESLEEFVKGENADSNFTSTRSTISEFLAILKDRPLISALLHKQLAHVYNKMKKKDDEIVELNQSTRILDDLHVQLDSILLITKLDQARALADQGKNKEADLLFLDCFEYPVVVS